MADLIRQRSISQGHDPRKFTVYAFGGAGPTHLPLIRRRLNIDEVIVPAGEASSVWSAVGISSADVLYRTEASNIRTFAPFDPEDINARFDEAETEVVEKLTGAGYDRHEIELERYAKLSYGMQVHEVSIPVPNGRLDEDDMGQMVERFERKYADLYGENAGASETGFELVTVRVDGYGPQSKPKLEAADTESNTGQPDRQQIYWPAKGRHLDTEVYYQEDLSTDFETTGPAVFRLDNTTVTIPPGDTVQIDQYNNIKIRET